MGLVESDRKAGNLSCEMQEGSVLSLIMCTHNCATISLIPSQTHSLYLPNANAAQHSREGKTYQLIFLFSPEHTHTLALNTQRYTCIVLHL